MIVLFELINHFFETSERERETETDRERERGWKLRVQVNLLLRVSLYKQWGFKNSDFNPLIAEKYNVATCESVAYRSYFTNTFFVLFVRCAISDICVQ